VRVDESLPPAVFQLRTADGTVLLTMDLGYTEAVEGEVLPALPRCPHCPHLLTIHLDERGACLHTTETETWACACGGPDPQDGGEPGMPA